MQPLDQGIIWCVKTTYICLVFDRNRAALDANPNAQLMELWKLFTTADAKTFIKTAMDESKPETVNVCWKVMWNEVVKDFIKAF